MGYVLAIDQGTTSSRAILFDDAHAASSPRRRRSSRSTFPQSGWVEHDPADIWSTVAGTCRAAIERAGARRRATSPPSASPTSARRRWSGTARPASRSATPSSGRTGAPRRSAPSCAPPGHEAMITERTGLLLDPYFSGTKLKWLLDAHEGARERARARRAPVRHRRQLPDLEADRRPGARHRRHQRRAHAALQHPRRRAGTPRSARCSTCRWRCCRRCATAPPTSARPAPTSSARAIPILGVAGDQQAATVGQACFAPGMLKSTYGTGCFAVLNTGDDAGRAAATGCSTTIAYQLDGRPTYALEGSIFIAGAVVQWLRDGLKIIRARRRDAGAGRGRRPGPAALPRAGLHRPRRALLGPGLPRRDLRADPQLRPGRARPRRARERRLPDPRPRSRRCAPTGRAAAATPCCASTAA